MTRNTRKALRYAVFALMGYVLAFILIFVLFGLLGVTGWYIVYVPFLSVLGSVVALFFVNVGKA